MKGKYIENQENLDNFHGKPITGEKCTEICNQLKELIVD